MTKTRSGSIPLSILACLVIAAVAYLWATGTMDSLYAFRSPLANQPPAPGQPLGKAHTRRVVFVLIDGLRTDTAADASIMPFLNELRARGASAMVHSRPPSFSAPSYTVLFSGAWPDLSDGPALNLEYDQYWTWTQDDLFSAVHRAGWRTAVSGYYWFEKLIPPDAVADHFYTARDDSEADRQVVDAALPWLNTGEDQFVLIHLDQVDYAGHYEGGPRSPAWGEAAHRVDSLLREIAAPLDLARDTLVVTSDHGHIDGGGHGGQEAVVLVVPFVGAGAGITPGNHGDMEMIDLAPTLAVLLGANIPASAQGRVLSGMLTLRGGEADAMAQAEASQQAALASAYTAAIRRPPVGVAGDAHVDVSAAVMAEARAARLRSERLPRLGLVLVTLAVVCLLMLRARGRGLAWGLVGVAAYLLLFNLRYAFFSRRTYSLSSVLSANELILYVALNTLLAFALGWCVFGLGARLDTHKPAEAARLTLSWTLLAVAVTALPALFSFAWNGAVLTWTMPDFNSFFLGFLATLQSLFVAVFGILFAGIAALVSRMRYRALGLP